MGKTIFWLSLLSGLPASVGIPFQSLNISAIPALLLLLFGSKKRIPIDCAILLTLGLYHLCVSFYYFSADSLISLLQISSVFVVYISLRILKYFPSPKGVLNFLFINLFVGLLQSFEGLGARGVRMLESEPSRSARSLAVLILPISNNYDNYKALASFISIPSILLIVCVLNRSGSLVLVLGYLSIIFFIYAFKWLKSYFMGHYYIAKRVLLYLFSALFGGFLLFWFSPNNNRAFRFVYVLKTAYNALSNFSGAETLTIILQIAGRRLQTIFPIYANAITSWPKGIDGYKVFITPDTLSSGIFKVSQYHLDILEKRIQFEPASFSAASIAQGGFISFALLISFSLVAWLLLSNKCHTTLTSYGKVHAFKAYSCMAGLIVSFSQIWFYSTDSILQPWLLLAISINYFDSIIFTNSDH